MSSEIKLNNYGLVDRKNGKWLLMIVQAPSVEDAVDVYKYVFKMKPGSDFKVIKENGNHIERRMSEFIRKSTGGMRYEWETVKDVLDKNKKADEIIKKELEKQKEKITEKADALKSKGKIKVGYGD